MFDVSDKFGSWMIARFHDKHTENLFRGKSGHRGWQSFEKIARCKLLMLQAAGTLGDLKNPPGNELEELKRHRKGQHSIRVDDQCRVCFTWRNAQAYDVAITDYH